MSIELLVLLFFIYSFAGWLMESTRSIRIEGKFVNRGFLLGPICPIYGWGVTLITVLLRKYQNDAVITFFMGMLICGVLEYATSFFMEKLFNARWWDYTNRKFNINGRICLETLIPFGILGWLIMYVTNPFFMRYLVLIPMNIVHILVVVLTGIYVIDSSVSLKIILDLKEVKKEFKDNTEEISEKVRAVLFSKSRVYRRLINAFPRIKESIYYQKWDETREKMKNKKSELENEIHEIKADLHDKKEEIKVEFHDKKEEVRNELHDKKVEVKAELHDKKVEVKNELSHKKDSIKNKLNNKKKN